MIYNPLPSQEYLKECFNYDPDTGILTWKERPLHHFKNEHIKNRCNSEFSSKIAGFIKRTGYVQIKISGKIYELHRIIWKLVTGNDPIEEIDHINNDPSDNRWSNLRESTHQENCINRKKFKNCLYEHKGISFLQKIRKWQAQIQVNNNQIYLGIFTTSQEAYQAYCEAATKYHKDFKKV